MKKYRELNGLEKKILDKLLERDFPGREEIKDQINNSKVRVIDEYGDDWGSIEFKTNSHKSAKVESRVPVQALVNDTDGILVEIFLHVVKGFIDELEIVKADNSPLKAKISPEKMKVELYSEIKKG